MRLFCLLLAWNGLAMAADPPAWSRDVAAQTFDQVWEQVRAQYFDYERIAEDWVQARATLRRQALDAPDLAAFRAVLKDLLDRIGESHFTVIPGEAMRQLEEMPVERAGDNSGIGSNFGGIAATGLAVRLIDGVLKVTRSAAGSSAAEAGIRRGWTLTRLDGYPLERRFGMLASEPVAAERTLLEAAVNSVLAFPGAGQVLELGFLDESGKVRDIELAGERLDAELVQLGHLPPMPYAFDLERVDFRQECATVLTFPAWTPELIADIQSRRAEMFQCSGLVIDLSGNLGGVIGTMSTLAGHLFDELTLLGTLIRSDGRIDFRAFPRRVTMTGERIEPFSGPIAIIVDRLSASTSEMFASGMQAAGRARIFGERTPGMALPAQMLPLVSGDVLMYAFADYADGQGRRIEGVGVMPDEVVGWAEPEPYGEQSPPLAAALAWIESQLQSGEQVADCVNRDTQESFVTNTFISIASFSLPLGARGQRCRRLM